MFDTPKIKKKTVAFRSKKNVKKMLSLTERLKEIKRKETNQMSDVNWGEKINKGRRKPNLQNFSAKQNPEGNRTVSTKSKADVNRGKGAKKKKTNTFVRANQSEEKPESPQSTFFLPQPRKSFQNFNEEFVSKKSLPVKSFDENSKGSTNKLIFVSLDFIEDCQTYKKKFIKPMYGQDLKSLRKSLRNISSYHKRYLNNKEQTQLLTSKGNIKTYKQIQNGKNQSQKKVTQNSSANEGEGKTPECSAVENSQTTSAKADIDAKVRTSEEPLNDEQSGQWEIPSTETFSVKQPSSVKASSEDVSTVDKKYIELLLSIANCNETKQKLNTKNHEPKDSLQQDRGFRQSDKKKISGKTFFENKIKKEKMEEEKHFRQNERRFSDAQKKSFELNDALAPSQPEGTVFARLVRDLTKSEVQILPRKRKNLRSSRNSDNQTAKKLAHSKPEVDDNRKKRKTRNNALKNDNEDVIEMPFPREISKVADVKELWRRGSREKSDNSLSSRSSSTLHENEPVSECKNIGLESYKILRKIVEDEVKTICKKFVEEKNEKNGIVSSPGQNNQAEPDSESKTLNKMCKELRTIMSENVDDIFDINGNKADEAVLPKEEEHLKVGPNREKMRHEDDFLKYLDKHEAEHLNPELFEQKKELPNEMVKNWSILHRLEQAFLALGTPTFPNSKLKDSKALKITGTKALKKSKEDVKCREGEPRQKNVKIQPNPRISDKPERKGSANEFIIKPKPQKDGSESHNSKPSSKKTGLRTPRNVKVESDARRPLQKKKSQGSNYLKTGSQQGTNTVNSRKIPEGEDKSKTKKGKSQNQKPNLNESKKSPPRSLAKPKVFEFESRYAKRDKQQKKLKHNATAKNPLSVKAKCLELKGEQNKEKPSNTVTSSPNQNEDENLERKKTFDVIPLKVSSKIKPRKSKSYNKIDDGLELDNAKKRFPPTRSADSKNLYFRNISEIHQTDNDKIKPDLIKLKPDLTQKNSAKPKLSPTHDRPKTVSEKECFRGNREPAPKPVKDRLNQDKRSEKMVPEEDLPRQILARKAINNCQDRAVKERSILSMRGNQHGSQPQQKTFLQLQKKTVCNLPEEHGPSKLMVKLPEKDIPKDFNTLLDMCTHVNTPESFSCASTGTFDVMEPTLQENLPELCPQVVIAKVNDSEVLEELSSLFSLSTCALEQTQNVEVREIKRMKRQPVWEKDIKQYRAIVKEIMSHYKRIDGFLKQEEHPQSFPNDPVSLMPKEDASSDGSGQLSRNLQSMNLYEYRRKILSEYQALPIFEYKKKIQQEAAANNKLDEKRRNLSFVKPLKTEMDLDVKDYELNIQKILDSQLYVDTENILKRKELYEKFSEKKSSLQEIVLSKNEKKLNEEECLRSISTPKTFLSLPRTPVHSNSAQNFLAEISNADSSVGIKTQVLKL